jgi:type IV pilus assembly protein PilO
MAMNLDLNSLDLSDLGRWPALLKVGAIVVLCGLVAGAGYYLDTQEQLLQLESAEQQEQKLKAEFQTKQAKAANLEAYRQQMREMEESFGTMLRQLPSKTEVAELLVDITQTGLASGLEFDLFQPKPEARHEFYAELPITIRVNGDFHQFGKFVSGVASLPRIVTLHEIAISRNQARLVLSAAAKTYRYLDEEELASAQSKAKAQSKKGRKK